MLEVKNLSITVNEKYMIKDLSFVLNNNDKLAIIGEEGNGKSTLLKVILGKCDYCKYTGIINYNKNRLGYLKQFLDEDELALSVFDYLFNDIDYYKSVKNLYSYMDQLEIKDELLDRNMSYLSGGEKVKISILKLLLEDNDILLLDEPTNDLDIQTLDWLEKFIISSDKPIIFISHDETLLSNTANMILHIEQIKKKEQCRHTIVKTDYDDYINTRINMIVKQNQIAKAEKKDYDKQIQKLTQIKNKVDHQLNTITRANPHGGQLLKKKMHAVKSQEKRITNKELTQRFESEENINIFFENVFIPNKKEVISLDIPSLTVEERILTKSISLEIYGSKKIVICGNNGVGKTTLLKIIYDMLKNREDLNVGYMPQNYDEVLNRYKNVLDYLCPEADKATISRIRTNLASLNITSDEAIGDLSKLSGGSKAKVFLLKLIIDKCNVLVLDEPTRNLSPLSNPIIRNILRDYGGTIISVSHDRKFIEEVCDELYILKQEGLKKA